MVTKATLVKFTNRSKRQANTEQAKREMPMYSQEIILIAKARKISYAAHIQQGFTPEQSLFLCKEMT
jgi:hypothetical protein